MVKMHRSMFKRLVLFAFICLTVGLAACDSGDRNLIGQAERLFERGRFQQAAAVYEKYLQRKRKGPRRPEARLRLGQIHYYALGDRGRGVEELGRLIQEYPRSEEAFQAREIMAAAFRNHAEDYEQAVVEYKWLANQRPQSPKAPYYLLEAARTYIMAGQMENAVLELGGLLGRYPQCEYADDAYEELGSAYLALGRPQETIFILTHMLRRFPRSPLAQRALFRIAEALESMQLYDEALKIYRRLRNEYQNREAVDIRIKGVLQRKKQQLGSNVDAGAVKKLLRVLSE
jgi:TolA-binding protein